MFPLMHCWPNPLVYALHNAAATATCPAATRPWNNGPLRPLSTGISASSLKPRPVFHGIACLPLATCVPGIVAGFDAQNMFNSSQSLTRRPHPQNHTLVTGAGGTDSELGLTTKIQETNTPHKKRSCVILKAPVATSAPLLHCLQIPDNVTPYFSN